GRGQARRDEALERVARRQGAGRAPQRRRGRVRDAARGAQAQDREDRSRLSASVDADADEPGGVFGARRQKLAALRAAGIDPFPHTFGGVEPIAAVRAAHEALEAGEETDVAHRVAGRLAARRGQGKMAFLDLVDRSGRIQLQARVDELGAERMGALLELDLGDLLGVDGVALRSRRGELTLRVRSFTLLAKSLRPPPDKHAGLADVETRFRRREADLVANEDVRLTFLTRARVISAIRRYLDEHGFIEVETP